MDTQQRRAAMDARCVSEQIQCNSQSATMAHRASGCGSHGGSHGVTMAAKLIAIAGPLRDYQWELGNDAVSIGRELSNDICIPAGPVSRHHCRVVRNSEGFAIEDLG